MSLSPQFLDELRARTLLSTLIGKSLKLQRAGREWKACCPFHNEKSPSFYVNDDKGFYHCFGCGAHGDAIRWMTDQNGLSFIEAVKELAATSGLDMPAPDPRAAERQERSNGLYDVMAAAQDWFVAQLQGIEGAEARAYLERRGISAQTATDFGIGFAPDSRGKLKAALATFGESKLIETGLLILVEEKEPYDRFRGRLMIPIRDPRGRVIAFGGRILGVGEPKYLNSPDTPLFDKGRTLYNLDRAAGPARKANRLIIVEGYMDVIALVQAGIEEVVAPLGTAMTQDQIERSWKAVDIPTLCLDGDPAGRKASIRAALNALPLLSPGKSLQFVHLPDSNDPDDFVRRFGAGAMRQLLALPQSLVDELWNAELVGIDAASPDGRAKLKQRTFELVAAIGNSVVAKEYGAAFNERWWARFGWNKWKKSEIVGIRGALASTRQPKNRAPQDAYIRSILLGLSRFPSVLRTESEAVSALVIDNRYLSDWRHILLEAIYERPDLDEDAVSAILGESDVSPIERRDLQRDLGFSFFRQRDGSIQALSDLREVINAMNADRELALALEEAMARFKESMNEDLWDNQQRLQEAKLAASERLQDLAASFGPMAHLG
jgi:DNA primase